MDYSLYLIALCYSGLLSLLGLAIVLRHRVSGIPDFSIVVYLGLGVMMSTVAVTLGLNLYVGPVLALAAGCLLGMGQYWGVERVMEKRGDDTVRRSLVTIGVQIIGTGLLACGALGIDTRPGEQLHIFHSLQQYDFTLLDTKGIYFVIPIVCLVVYALFLRLSRRTMYGALITASGEEPELAMIQGVNPWRAKLAVWAISGGFAAFAGSLFPPFLHVTPGAETLLLVPIFAVGVLSGFGSLLIAVIAAYIVGFGEILCTLLGQNIFGVWFGEYRPLISMAFLYFGMLLIPRGLIELRAPLLGAVNYLRRDRRRTLKILAAALVLVALLVAVENAYNNAVEYEKTSWINVSNSIGIAGAKIFGDAPDSSLPENLYFDNVYPPKNLTTIHDLSVFAATIKNTKAIIVYKHNDVLYLIVDENLGYVYDPRDDNFGR